MKFFEQTRMLPASFSKLAHTHTRTFHFFIHHQFNILLTNSLYGETPIDCLASNLATVEADLWTQVFSLIAGESKMKSSPG